MKLKKFIVLTSLLLLLFLSIGMASANENTTVESEGIDVEQDSGDIEGVYNAEIINANDYTAHYQSNDQLYFDIEPYNGVYEFARFDMVDNDTGSIIGVGWYHADEYSGYGFVERGVGNYKVTLKLSDNVESSYKIKPVTINVKITKAPVKLTAQKWISTTKEYATLKATVKDEYNCPVKEGTVKFTINGKTYTIKVKNGVATKKVKLTKAKIYDYKATFSSKNYKTKTVYSKVHVKKYKKHYTFKSGKYTFKMGYSKYLKLINAKNNKKYKSVSSVVGKQYGKYPVHMYVETFPRDMQYQKGDYVIIWIDNGMGIESTISKKINLYTLNP